MVAPLVGTGHLPDPALAEWYSLDLEAEDPIALFRAFEQAMAFAKVEMDRAAAQFPPAYAELGRQFVEAKSPPVITPPPETLPAARSAVGRLTMAAAELDQKRKRLAELEAT